MVSLGLIFATAWVAFFLYKIQRLYGNVKDAQATGLQFTITPSLETEFWGYVLTPILRKVYHSYLLEEKGWPRWCRFMIKDWSWEDRRRAHDEYGDVFLVVSPEGIICYSADAATNHDVMARRAEYIKPRDKYKLLELYGPNVVTAEAKIWQFHLRITAPPFSDQSGVNELVWNEACYQTRQFIKAWDKQKTRELESDVNGITLAIISLAGMGKRLDWTSSHEDQKEEIPEGYKLSFFKATIDTNDYIIAILLLPVWLMQMIPGLQKIALAYQQLDKYMREMIRSEKQKLFSGKEYSDEDTVQGNLLTSLVQTTASEEDPQDETNNSKKRSFTEDEVMGNLFIYFQAGYETTANAIMYGMIALALYEEHQDRVIEEIDRVLTEAKKEGRSELTYKDDFEKLEYTYGFMYEILRVFPGVHFITKMTPKANSIVISDSKLPGGPLSTVQLPADCRVYLNSVATHYSEKYWHNSTKIDPSRWTPENLAKITGFKSAVAPDSVSSAEKKVVAADRTRQMRGTFLTFSDGGRACLGRKFAQAEFIAFLVTLLQEFRVVLGDGVDRDEVERDLYFRCAGKTTLAPNQVKMKLQRRANKGGKDL